jgi:hypothetical protein
MFQKELSKRAIANEVEKNGFTIVRGAIDQTFVKKQRDRWLDYFASKPNTTNCVLSGLILGEPNFCSYSQAPALCMYRYFEFLWNDNDDQEALDMHLAIHRMRNEIQGFPLDYGLHFSSQNYGVYISTSLYPIRYGMLEEHVDGHGDIPILHYMLPLSFKGKDFSDGGLHIRSKQGDIIDIDSLVSPGDLIFFDGRCKHWVKKIEASDPSKPGRLAVFAIPTYFMKVASTGIWKRSLKIQTNQILATIKSFITERQRYPEDT